MAKKNASAPAAKKTKKPSRKPAAPKKKTATMNPVVHFEMPYEDGARLAKFYTSAFGWQMQILGEQMGHYVLATTSESDQVGPRKPGTINGGFFPKTPEMPTNPSVVIDVPDIKQAIAKVNDAGGKVLGEPMLIPGIGHYVSFTDTEGNRVGMIQHLSR